MSRTIVMTTPAPPRTVHVEHCMGTVFSIDIRDPGPWAEAIAAVTAWLHRVDAVFSTYRADSDISRLQRQEMTIQDADPLVPEVLDLCQRMAAETDGFFSAYWDGQLDPTGLVKGWAIERASRLLSEHGSHHHAVNGGGDVQTVGEPSPGKSWRIGIADPLHRDHILSVVTGRGIAVATSGVAERGKHIVDPHTRRPADELASVTVVGEFLTSVDCYATAAFAMGAGALPWLEALPGHEALVVSSSGTSRSTSGLRL